MFWGNKHGCIFSEKTLNDYIHSSVKDQTLLVLCLLRAYNLSYFGVKNLDENLPLIICLYAVSEYKHTKDAKKNYITSKSQDFLLFSIKLYHV